DFTEPLEHVVRYIVWHTAARHGLRKLGPSARRSGQQIERNGASNGSRIGRRIVRVYRLT
ncbi:MAG TPA: hypothetical protein VN683_04665, partial [Acidothermaceae bacterium]|nr:hypothetical protein [Acidothermaceae bacterium]